VAGSRFATCDDELDRMALDRHHLVRQIDGHFRRARPFGAQAIEVPGDDERTAQQYKAMVMVAIARRTD
jgi:hypothetical protein